MYKTWQQGIPTRYEDIVLTVSQQNQLKRQNIVV